MLGIHTGNSNMKISECLSLSEDKFIMMTTKHPVHIRVFRVITNNGDIMLPFVFPHAFTLNIDACNIHGLCRVALDQEDVCWKTLRLATRLFHATQTELRLVWRGIKYLLITQEFILHTCDVGAVWHLIPRKISPSQDSCFGHKVTGK